MRKIRNLILTLLLMFVGVVSTNALTKLDLDYINDDFSDLALTLYECSDESESYCFFSEGSDPSVSAIQDYILYGLLWELDDKYILNKDYYENMDETINTQIPAEDFEGAVANHFNVTNNFYKQLRENYRPGYCKKSEYKEIDGKYYYYSENMYNMGSGNFEDLYIIGYKDLGNNQYQLYIGGADEYFEESELADKNNLFIKRESFDNELKTYLVNNYYTAKIEYKEGNVKYLSFVKSSKDSLPNDLNMYEDVASNTSQPKDEWDSFVNYFVNSEIMKPIEADDINIVSDDKSLTIEITVENQSYETEYVYKDGILTYSKKGNKYYDDIFNNIVLAYFRDKYNYSFEKFSNYIYSGYPTNDLKIDKDGIEYTLEEYYTEEEVAKKQKELDKFLNTLDEQERKEYEDDGLDKVFNPLIITKLKIDLKNRLKTYDETKIPYYNMSFNIIKYEIGKSESITVRIPANFDQFEAVYLDNKLVDKSNYEAKSGSTIVTLKKEFLDELKEGNHVLKVTFKDGEFAQSKFEIKKPIENPKTGIVIKYGMLILIIIVSVFIYSFIKKKSKFPKHN